MSENKVYYSMVINNLNKNKKLAQSYLIEGCLKYDRELIDIALKYGAKMNKKGFDGITPLEILKK